MIDSGIHVLNHSNRQDEIQIFGRPILLTGLFDPANQGAGLLTTADLNPRCLELGNHGGKEGSGDCFVDKQRFHRVAYGRPLDLGIRADALRHLQRCLAIHIDVADTFEMPDYGNPRVCSHHTDELFPTARNNKVDVIFELEQLVNHAPIFGLNHLNRPLWDSSLGAGLLQYRANSTVGKVGLTPPS